MTPVESADAAHRLGARRARVEFPIGTAAADMRATIAAYADRGIAVLPLAGFPRALPSREAARSLAGWAREFGPGGAFWADRSDGHLAIMRIEFGNETSYTQPARGGEYALRLRDTFRAIRASDARVGLLAQADDANRGPRWLDAMFRAVPDLADMVDGWTIHPYGPRSSWEPRIDRLIAQTRRHGAGDAIPIDVTEWGLATDDGRCLSSNYGWPDRCMTYDAAARALRDTIAGMTARYGARLRSLFVYQATDQMRPGATSDREHYFGALRRDLGEKDAYTAEVRRQLAAGSARTDLPASPGSWLGHAHHSDAASSLSCSLSPRRRAPRRAGCRSGSTATRTTASPSRSG